MAKRTPFILPGQLNFGPSLGRTPSSPGKALFETVRKRKSRAVDEIDLGKAAKETVIAHVVEGSYEGQSFADHFLHKGNRPFVHALINGFRRYLDMLVDLRHFRRQLREGCFGITPDPEGDQGEEDFARNFRGPFDKAGLPCGSFKVFGGKEFC